MLADAMQQMKLTARIKIGAKQWKIGGRKRSRLLAFPPFFL
jgi:hypothetical protein